MPWYIFSAINVLALAGLALGLRWGLRDGRYNPNLYSIANLVYAGILFVVLGFAFGYDMDLGAIPLGNLLLGGILNVGIYLFVARSLALIEVGPYSMIVNLRSAFIIPLTFIFLEETASWSLAIGALLVLIAAMMVSYQPGQRIRASKGELYALLAAVGIAIAFTNEVVVFDDNLDPPLFLALEHFIAGSLLMLIFAKHTSELGKLIKNTDFHIKAFVPSAAIVIALLAIFAAFQSDTDASLLTAIAQAATVVAVLASIWLLNEKDRMGIKIVAAVVGTVGLVILAL